MRGYAAANKLYEAMDKLLSRQEHIQRAPVARHLTWQAMGQAPYGLARAPGSAPHSQDTQGFAGLQQLFVKLFHHGTAHHAHARRLYLASWSPSLTLTSILAHLETAPPKAPTAEPHPDLQPHAQQGYRPDTPVNFSWVRDTPDGRRRQGRDRGNHAPLA